MTDPLARGRRRFPIRLGQRSRLLLLLFGVRGGNAWVDVSAEEIDANFGFYHMRVALSNVASWRIEGPWLWVTAIGLRRGIFARDITFGGNHKGGVRIDFKTSEKWGIFHVPRLYVTVADLEGL